MATPSSHFQCANVHMYESCLASLLQESLVPVPTQLFQGSLLLGSIANAVLGESAMSNSNVLIHPVLIGGWCGLVATALNSLPVGSLDGGKMTQVVPLPALAAIIIAVVMSTKILLTAKDSV